MKHAGYSVFQALAVPSLQSEAAPIILTSERVYVLPTKARLTYAAALQFMLIGAVNYNPEPGLCADLFLPDSVWSRCCTPSAI
ncbi:MAG: hypothetical protein M5R42_04280 [Rhodocyclaceae bacterium]|nr:hypothetical protein [Rhodocyclaceae bacterium]